MDVLQKAFDEAVLLVSQEAKSEEELEKIAQSIPSKMDEAISRLPEDMLSSIKEMASEGLKERRQLHSEFVNRNVKRWQKAFDLMELHVAVSTEAGQLFNQRLRPEAAAKNDILFDVLVRLHAKGCLISQNICCLLKNGFADGAHARWRALHEINVTSMFLSRNGCEAAERYVYHEFVESYKAARQHREYQPRLNEQGPSDEEFEQLKAEYNQVICKEHSAMSWFV